MNKTTTVLCLALLLPATAFAGKTLMPEVSIDFDRGVASGAMYLARFSENPDAYIGCGTRTYDNLAGGVDEWGFCQAGLSDTEFVICTTTNPGLVHGMQGSSDFSYVTFAWQDADGDGRFECIYAGYSTQSLHLPAVLAPDDDDDSDSDD